MADTHLARVLLCVVVYCADSRLQDDKLKLPRQNLPEFCYEYHIELLYDPVLAEEAIVNLIANTKFYASDSPRARMFGRCSVVPDALPVRQALTRVYTYVQTQVS